MSKLTLDEAIKHCLEVTENNEQFASGKWIGSEGEANRQECEQCAADHRQLAEWLKELKELRAKSTHSKWIPKYDDKHGFHYICGNCNAISGTKTTFCFDCGADMKKEYEK